MGCLAEGAICSCAGTVCAGWYPQLGGAVVHDWQSAGRGLAPVRRKDHRMFDPTTMEQVSTYARQHGIRLHLDGARMFSLPHHSGRSLQAYTSLFDTVYVSLWKHFNGASGALLTGDASFIEGLFQTRREFGGSLPQAWPQIALIAASAERFQDD